VATCRTTWLLHGPGQLHHVVHTYRHGQMQVLSRRPAVRPYPSLLHSLLPPNSLTHRSRRPEAAANAGFSQALIALEKKLRGTRSVEGSSAGSQAERASALELLGGKKAKPEGVRCPVCSEQVSGWVEGGGGICLWRCPWCWSNLSGCRANPLKLRRMTTVNSI
jgi:hypothetical protein